MRNIQTLSHFIALCKQTNGDIIRLKLKGGVRPVCINSICGCWCGSRLRNSTLATGVVTVVWSGAKVMFGCNPFVTNIRMRNRESDYPKLKNLSLL